jgi:hypothetical protein
MIVAMMEVAEILILTRNPNKRGSGIKRVAIIRNAHKLPYIWQHLGLLSQFWSSIVRSQKPLNAPRVSLITGLT